MKKNNLFNAYSKVIVDISRNSPVKWLDRFEDIIKTAKRNKDGTMDN